MADIVHCSAMERFAANMPHIVGLDLRKSPHYPNIARWYAVMDRRSAYQKVKSDDTTLNLVIRYVLALFALSAACCLGVVLKPFECSWLRSKLARKLLMQCSCASLCKITDGFCRVPSDGLLQRLG